MTWMGPTYGQWADTIDEIDEAYASLAQVKKSRNQWIEYAKKLEGALKDLQRKHTKLNELYLDMTGAERAQAKVKNEALEEIKKTNPSSKLLDPDYRAALYDNEKEKAINELKNR